MSNKILVIADVHGHAHGLRRLLEKHGVVFDVAMRKTLTGPDYQTVGITWVDGLRVVSAGDHIHRGPDDDGVLILINRLVEAGHWTPLVGNHEQLYLGSPAFHWHKTISEGAQNTLKNWWVNQLMHPGALVKKDGQATLVTHAGLTRGFWHHVLGRETNPDKIIASISELRLYPELLYRPGLMLDMGNVAPGFIWAEAANEVYPSWVDADHLLELNQIHGHSSPFDFARSQWWTDNPHIKSLIKVNTQTKTSHATVGTMHFDSIDPGHGIKRSSGWSGIEINNATLQVN